MLNWIKQGFPSYQCIFFFFYLNLACNFRFASDKQRVLRRRKKQRSSYLSSFPDSMYQSAWILVLGCFSPIRSRQCYYRKTILQRSVFFRCLSHWYTPSSSSLITFSPCVWPLYEDFIWLGLVKLLFFNNYWVGQSSFPLSVGIMLYIIKREGHGFSGFLYGVQIIYL